MIDEVCARFGYGEIRTPIFESTEVFERTLGPETDVVAKEMYTFTDRSGRSITLRPEYTAPVVRAILEHNMLQALPLKLYYRGPIFRYERPQKGRYRQAHQWGVELFGVAGPEADAEIIALGIEVLREIGVRDFRLDINSMGCEWGRAEYRSALIAYLEAHAAELSETSRQRLTANPLRILDSKDERDRRVLTGAPTIDSYWCEACRAHLTEERALLGAQNAICGGGRYDRLVEDMGGPPTPGVGLAMGVERMLMLVEEARSTSLDGPAPLHVALIALENEDVRALIPIMHALRARGIRADMDYTRRKLEKQLRTAGDRGARFAVIVGGDERTSGEATVQDLHTRERTRVKLAEVSEAVARRLEAR